MDLFQNKHRLQSLHVVRKLSNTKKRVKNLVNLMKS